MASNTEILIKRSSVTTKPATLRAGELAYSYLSNTLFFGTAGGNGTVNVGGVLYTSTIDAATSSNTAGTLVKRDNNNAFSGRLYGLSNTALTWNTAREIGVTGDATGVVSVDGSANANIPLVLTNTGVAAGQYGSATEVPTIVVASNGRVLSVTTNSISSSITVDGDSGSGTLVTGNTLTVAGGAGLTSVSTGSGGDVTVTIDVDNTVFRANTSVGKQLVAGDVEISGNLKVIGNVTSIDVQTLNVSDPLLYLAGNNYASDIVDIGFVGNYFDGASQRHTGVIRHAGDKQYYIFDNYDKEPGENVVDITDASFRLATLHTNLTGNTVNAHSVYVANRVYGDTTNNTLYLIPSTSYSPEVNDQYIIVDPTGPNHIHLRAGGTIDNSNTELFLGGENTGVQVSDPLKETYIRANSYLWAFTDNGRFKLSSNNYIYDTVTTIFIDSAQATFTGNVTSNGSATFQGNVFAPNLPNVRTSNLVYFDSSNGKFSYADDNAITPTSIANGSYFLTISGTNGAVSTNGAGFVLTHGATIKDTAGDAVAFGQNAGTISQGNQSVAIGDSAGYNTQGAFGVAIGYGAGNISQGQAAVAIGINAGLSNQGTNGVAIGNSSGSNQGQNSIALGYDSGGMQGNFSVAIGHQAGKGNTSAIGVNTIAIGNMAAFQSGFANSIILNASGSNLSSSNSGFFVSPVRYTASQDSTDDGFVFYNQFTKEVRYSYAIDGGTF